MKNLEEEYKNSQQEEMPDLWNRIEAGLTEKKKPIPLLSATRYLGIVAAAAALLLIVSLGLWSGRRSTENNASYMALQNGAASSPYNNSANMSANDEAFLQEAVVEEIGQEPDQNGLSFPSVMEDETEDASLQEIMAESQEISNSQTSVGSMSPENAVAKDETTLSAEDALAHLGAYLEEAGMLPADRELYGTGEGERPGYAWAGVAADDGEPARMFLEFYAYSEDGSYLIFCMGKRASEGDENVLLGEYAVHVLTGDIEYIVIAKLYNDRAEQYKKNPFYEYDYVVVPNKPDGSTDKESIKEILTSHAMQGWKLVTMYSNEIGKNAITVGGVGGNVTICEDVLLFERCIKRAEQ